MIPQIPGMLAFVVLLLAESGAFGVYVYSLIAWYLFVIVFHAGSTLMGNKHS